MFQVSQRVATTASGASGPSHALAGLRSDSRLGKRSLRLALIAATAATATAVFTPNFAQAANECGAIPAGPNSTVNCSGIFGGGIEYEPAAANEVFTLNLGDGTIGGSTQVTAPNILGVGQAGVGIADYTLGAITGGVQATSVLNINKFSTASGGAVGGVVITDGTGNDATINNSGTVTGTGSGLPQLLGALDGDGLVAIAGFPGGAAGSGTATVNNLEDGTVNAFRHGLIAYSIDGNAVVTNKGEVTTQNGDGMTTADPLTGLIPSGGTASGTNSGTLNAGDDGMVIVGVLDVTATNSATGVVNATDTGMHAYSFSKDVTATNDGEIVATNGDGINTFDHVTGLIPTGGKATATNTGSIEAGGVGMNVGAFGDATAINSSATSIVAVTGGINVVSINGVATGDNTGGSIVTTNNSGILAVGATGAVVNNEQDGSGLGGTVLSKTGDGITAIAADGGVDINGKTGTVEANNGGLLGHGVAGLMLPGGTGDVIVDAGTTTTPGSGVMAVNLGTGNATASSHGITKADGLFGVGAIAVDGTASVNINADIDPPLVGGFAFGVGGDADINVADGVTVEADAVGLLAIALAGNVDINAAGATVDSAGAGVIGAAIVGETEIDTGTVNAAAGSGVIGFALGGPVAIETHGNTTANGLFGVAGIALGGQSQINIAGDTVTNTDQIGVFGLAAGGDMIIDGVGSTINSDNEGIIATALGGNVIIDSNVINSTVGSGIIATAVGGSVDIESQGNINANDLFGIGAFSIGGDIDIEIEDGTTVTNTDQIGVFALALGGDVDIEAEGGDVVSDNEGIVATALGGNVFIDSHNVTSTVGSGIIGTAVGGDVDIQSFGDVRANDLFGVAAFSIAGDAEITLEAGTTVTNLDQIGLFALAIGGDADIEAEGSTVNADNEGIVATAIAGNVFVDAGDVNSTVGSGIIATAIAGDVDVDGHGDINANDLFGIGAFAIGGDAVVTLDAGTTLTNADQIGIFALATGDVSVLTKDATVNADNDGIQAFGNNVTVESGVINSTVGNGIISTAIGGDSTVTNFGKITADDGTFGIFSLSLGGDSTATAAADIDPPLFGMISATFGAGAATANVLPGVLVDGDFVGVIASNIGSGSATVNNEGEIHGGILGVGGLKIGPGGNLTINNIGADSSIIGEETAIGVVAFDPGAGVTNNVVINNDGFIHGDDTSLTGAPVIGSLTDGGLTVNNNATGVIRGLVDDPDHLAILAIGVGPDDEHTEVHNDGEILGRLVLLSGGTTGNFVDNHSTGEWWTAGSNVIGIEGADQLTNNGLIITGDPTILGDVTVFEFGDGIDTLDNDGEIFAGGPIGGVTIFDDLEFFNNFIGGVGGVIDMSDAADDTTDLVVINAAYDGGPLSGDLDVDAFLDLGGDSDELYINGSATGFTDVIVDDTNFGFAAAYDPVGMLVVDVDGPVDGQENFTLLGGPIDKGFFNYDLYFVPEEGGVPDTDNRWYLRNDVNGRAYELAKLVTATQEAWHESTGVWLDRTADLRQYMFQDAAENAPVSPGVWARGFGSWNQRDAHDTINTASGPTDVDTSYSQNTYGVQAGVDFSVMDVSQPNGTLLLGLMGGYTWSEVDFDETGDTASIDGFNVGGYATYMNNGFFADLLVKADLMTIDFDTTAFAPDSSDESNATSIGVRLDTGYRFGVKYGTEGWFLEPQGTLAYVHTSFEDIEMLNSDVELDDGSSLRGRLGARAGWTILTEDRRTQIEPFVHASAWHEFLNDNQATLSSAAGSVSVDDDAQGTWGEVGGGINVVNLGSGISGFVKGEYRFGNDITGGTVTGGLRYNW